MQRDFSKSGQGGLPPQRPDLGKIVALTSPKRSPAGLKLTPTKGSGGTNHARAFRLDWIWNSENREDRQDNAGDLSSFLKESYKQGLPFCHFSNPAQYPYIQSVLNTCVELHFSSSRCFRNCV